MPVLKMESGPKSELTEAKASLPGDTAVIGRGDTPAAGRNASAGQLAAQRTQVVNSVLGSIETVRREIDDVLADMKLFHNAEPDEVMRAVSAHSARLIEIIVQIGRIEVIRREWKPVREEAEKVLTELKSQFQIASRSMAVRQLDFQMAGGQV